MAHSQGVPLALEPQKTLVIWRQVLGHLAIPLLSSLITPSVGSRLQIPSWLSKTLLPTLEEASEAVSAFTLNWAAPGELLSSGANWPPTSGGQRWQDRTCWWAHSAAPGSVQARHTYGQNSQELDVKVHGSKPRLPGPSPTSWYCWRPSYHLALPAPASRALFQSSVTFLLFPFLGGASASGCRKYPVLLGPPKPPRKW